jgi:hypothetical protein
MKKIGSTRLRIRHRKGRVSQGTLTRKKDALLNSLAGDAAGRMKRIQEKVRQLSGPSERLVSSVVRNLEAVVVQMTNLIDSDLPGTPRRIIRLFVRGEKIISEFESKVDAGLRRELLAASKRL